MKKLAQLVFAGGTAWFAVAEDPVCEINIGFLYSQIAEKKMVPLEAEGECCECPPEEVDCVEEEESSGRGGDDSTEESSGPPSSDDTSESTGPGSDSNTTESSGPSADTNTSESSGPGGRRLQPSWASDSSADDAEESGPSSGTPCRRLRRRLQPPGRGGDDEETTEETPAPSVNSCRRVRRRLRRLQPSWATQGGGPGGPDSADESVDSELAHSVDDGCACRRLRRLQPSWASDDSSTDSEGGPPSGRGGDDEEVVEETTTESEVVMVPILANSWLVESFEHFKLAVDDINNNADLLVNCTLKFQAADAGLNKISAFGGVQVASDALAAQGKKFAAWVGPGFSDRAEFAAAYLSFQEVPILSPRATDVSFVKKDDFPYFVRGSLTDVDHFKGLLVFSKFIGWNNMALFQQDTRIQLFESVIEPMITALEMRLWRKEVNSLTIKTDVDFLELKFAGYRSILLDTPVEWISYVEQWAISSQLNGQDYMWLGKKECVPSTFKSAVISEFSALSADAQALHDAHVTRWGTLSTTWNSSTNGWHNDTNELFFNSTGTTFWDVAEADVGDGAPDAEALYVYDTTMLLANAMQSVLIAGGDVLDGPTLKQSILGADFEGLTGRMKIGALQDRVAPFTLSLRAHNYDEPALLAEFLLDAPGRRVQGVGAVGAELEAMLLRFANLGATTRAPPGADETDVADPLDENGNFCISGICIKMAPAVLDETLVWADNSTAKPMDGSALYGPNCVREKSSIREVKAGATVQLMFTMLNSFNEPACMNECAGLIGLVTGLWATGPVAPDAGSDVAVNNETSDSGIAAGEWRTNPTCVACQESVGLFQPDLIDGPNPQLILDIIETPASERWTTASSNYLATDDRYVDGYPVRIPKSVRRCPDYDYIDYLCLYVELPDTNETFDSITGPWLNGLKMAHSFGGISVHPEQCPPGSRIDIHNGIICENCLIGEYSSDYDSPNCIDCPEGSYADFPKSSECKLCPAGTFSVSAGQETCTLCPAGKFSASDGANSCDPCPFGTYSSSKGNSKCVSCSKRETRNCSWIGPSLVHPDVVSDESDSCVFRTTTMMGADSSDYCACPAGTYKEVNASGQDTNFCVGCVDGMSCDYQGMAEPQQQNGFWVEPDPYDKSAYLVWFCFHATSCPQGKIGECAENHEPGVQTCARCKAGYYPYGDGTCRQCDGVDIWPPVLFSFVIMGPVLFLFHMVSSLPLNRTRRSAITLMLQLTILVSTVLCFNVFSMVHVVWKPPLSNFWELFKVFMFNFDVLKFQCMTSTSNPVVLYLAKVLVPFILVFGLVAQSQFFRIFPGVLSCCGLKAGHFPFHRAAIFNTVGGIFSLFMISISIAALEPFHCVVHPSNLSTLAINHSVTCWGSSEHTALVIVGIFALLLFPVAVISAIFYVTLNFNKMIRSGRPELMQATAFIFKRFRPECYYFGFLFILRNFLFALVPAIWSNSLVEQILSLSLLLIIWILLVSHCQPWRLLFVNYADAIFTSCLVLILSCFGLLPAEHRFSRDSDEVIFVKVGWIGVAFASICLVGATGGILSVIFSRLSKQKKYKFFLSHHKRDAAVIAFQLKMMLAVELDSSKIFLDVDNLESLDSLGLIVRSDIEHLVVLVTHEIFTRMWCAMEMAVAFQNDVSMIPVICFLSKDPGEGDDVMPHHRLQDLLPDCIPNANMEGFWSDEQLSALRKSGVEGGDIAVAYDHLRNYLLVRQSEDITNVVEKASPCGTFFGTLPMLHSQHSQDDSLQVIMDIAKYNRPSAFAATVSQSRPLEKSNSSKLFRSWTTMDRFSVREDTTIKKVYSFALDDSKCSIGTIIICDFGTADILAAARVLGLMLRKQGDYAKAISPDQNNLTALKHDSDSKVFVVFLSPMIHLNPVAVAYLHFCMKRDLKHGKAYQEEIARLASATDEQGDGEVARSSLTLTSRSQSMIVPVFFNSFPVAVADWQQDALDGRLWTADFWEVLQKVDPTLQDDIPSRTKIVHDFIAIQSNLALQFSPDKSAKILGVEFDRIYKRISSCKGGF